jgi:hypothetical protein
VPSLSSRSSLSQGVIRERGLNTRTIGIAGAFLGHTAVQAATAAVA